MNVVLVGFMGTGKTTVGQKLAESLGFQFRDTDDRIEEVAGRSIAEIFAEEGEAGFRDREVEALREVLGGTVQVVSTGGGVVLREENRIALKQGSYCVWLTARVETILERVGGSGSRPLLAVDDPGEVVSRMLGEREPLYAEVADLKVATDELGADDLAYGIAETVRVAFRNG